MESSLTSSGGEREHCGSVGGNESSLDRAPHGRANVPTLDLEPYRGSRHAFNHHIYQRWFPTCDCTVDSDRKIGCPVDKLSMAPERGHDQVVACWEKLEVMHSVRSVRPQLDLALRIPAPVISDQRNEGQAASDGRLKFRQMKSQTAVSKHGENRRLRLGIACGQGKRQRASDCTGDSIHHSTAQWKHALRPLAELTAITD